MTADARPADAASGGVDADSFRLRVSVSDSDNTGYSFAIDMDDMTSVGGNDWELTLEFPNYDAALAQGPFSLRAISAGMDVFVEQIMTDACAGSPGWGTTLWEETINYSYYSGMFGPPCYTCTGDGGMVNGCF